MAEVLLFIVCLAIVAAVRFGLEKVFPGHGSMWYRYVTRVVTGIMLIIYIIATRGLR